MATVGEDLQNDRGRVLIPAGAVLIGTITDIAPAGFDPLGDAIEAMMVYFNTALGF